MTAAPVVVVGASMGGLRAAEQLRAAGWTGGITVVGDEPHMPYNRPPLSKDALAGGVSHAALAFRPRASCADVDWRLGRAAVAADLTTRRIRLADGEWLSYAGLVVATGLRPRRLTCPGPRGGRYVVRTLDDARHLRAALGPGRRVVVVGAGFIGCEVAATARSLGAEVTVVGPEAEPMYRPLGAELGAALRRRHLARGVRFELGRTVRESIGDRYVTGVLLDDGRELPADVVVEAVGSIPNTEWLAGNGLDLDDGVRCDALLRVESRPDVVAVGDVARFVNPRYDDVPRRVEHWSMPTDSAKRAARTLAAHLAGTDCDPTPFAPLPSFWSDQYDERLQSYGAPGLAGTDVRLLEGDWDGDCAVGYHRDDALVGVVALGGKAVASATKYRRALVG
ncbi:FAD-dependent oxidoreductase (plasmid) [Embleya sp. NBC_00888]|uniref:NAD(P)/FAD-dependent oxidoreductase n=1 Tax=Embleya sp. NBC_00888 TaxID=2975960 RepID=UPI002F9120DC|nr:FAD-dependent oxidoreductase [Embleya sp. NBC_00888]